MSIIDTLKEKAPRPWVAAAGSAMMRLRGDKRRFGVDAAGRWLNIQPEATFVSPEVYTPYFGQIEASVIDYWCAFERPRPGDTIIDVGAGIGEDAVVFSKLVGPRGRVISIEAHPKIFACLQGTIERSGLDNVVAVQCAVADHDGTVTMSDDDAHLANSVLKTDGGIEVPAKRLDSLLAEMEIDQVGLLKMNIEGAERPAMAGMTGCAPRIRTVAISCHDFVADAGGEDDFRTRDFVKPALEAMGFRIRQRGEAAHSWQRDTLYGIRA